jgi:hypothetical protein
MNKGSDVRLRILPSGEAVEMCFEMSRVWQMQSRDAVVPWVVKNFLHSIKITKGLMSMLTLERCPTHAWTHPCFSGLLRWPLFGDCDCLGGT